MTRSTGVALVLAWLAAGCSPLARIDYANFYRREGWQLPDRVIESLALKPGDRVADIGAGDGYFTFRLADAVGPEGRVYAVEIDDEKIRALQRKAAEDGYDQVVVVRATAADPSLPDREIDLAFLCNVYHHIGDRVPYFDRLRADLDPGGRVAIIDGREEFLTKLVVPSGHWTPIAQLHEEMRAAHYRATASFDFLPMQSFVIFEAASG